ncbi:hypothetical protein [Flavobacterium sp. J27]|uniref:hypothetical protein n=1 Tax=Flavobacterium sp. J27 TaxID=2060419 RepID=UPI001031D59C|nr:hypothetical protein [Flavobacterium sp. J27]
MKNFKRIIIIAALSFFIKTTAQVRIGGSVDISINLPMPKVIIVKEEPKPMPAPKAPKKQKVYKPKKQHCETILYSLGTIVNHTHRYGRVDLVVVDAFIENLGRGLERVTYLTNTRETLEIVIRTNNPNDCNYHYNTNPHCTTNLIVSVALNSVEMPLHNGSISLQPGESIYSVLNLNSVYEGSFNGSIQF